jgi:hypothetical protein
VHGEVHIGSDINTYELGMIGIIWIGVVSYRIRATLQRFSLLNNQHVYRLKLKHIRYIITRLSHKFVNHIF